jgi:hypothetical protein
MKLRLFIFKLLLFILPVASILLYIEHRLASIPNSYNTKRHNFEQQSDSIEVIVLGASHATYGINPAYFSHKGFNLADISQDMYFDSGLVMKYLPKLPRLRIVIIDADYMTLNYSLDVNPVENWRTSYYYKYWGIKSDKWQPFDMNNYSFIWLYSRPIVEKLARKRFDTSFVNNMAPNGWMRYDTLPNTNTINDETGKKRVDVINNLIAMTNIAKVHNCIKNFANALKARNIKVVLVSLPVYSTFSKFCNPELITKNNQFIDTLCKNYGCYYTNYFTDERFTIGDFHDNDHLNYRGAEKLSKLIDQEIIKPWLAPHPTL